MAAVLPKFEFRPKAQVRIEDQLTHSLGDDSVVLEDDKWVVAKSSVAIQREILHLYAVRDKNGNVELTPVGAAVVFSVTDLVTKASLFTLGGGGAVTINKTGKIRIKVRVAVGTQGTGPWKAEVSVRKNGAEVNGGRFYG